MSDPTDLLSHLIDVAAPAADEVAIENLGRTMTEAQRTRQVIDKAFRWAASQGLITILPIDQWPEYLEY